MSRIPAKVKAEYYLKYTVVSGYPNLTIKKNDITIQLKGLLNNNFWNLKQLSSALEQKLKIEHVDNNLISWNHDIALLDYKSKVKPNFKNGIALKADFLNYKYLGTNVQRTEENYINQFKNWLNNILGIKYRTKENLNFIVDEHIYILYSCLKFRSDNKQSLETFKTDIKLLLKLLSIQLDEKDEIIIKYKILLNSLRMVIENSEKINIIATNREVKTFVNYEQLLEIQELLQTNYNKAYLDLPIMKRLKDVNIREQNMIRLLYSFYVLFPPLRTEVLDLTIIDDEEDKDKYDNAIYIKDNKNIILYLNTIKKKHKPIQLNLNDSVIKSFSGNLPDRLIKLIVDSIKDYPRKYLFLNKNNGKSSSKLLLSLLNKILDEKKIGINALRSAYLSYYYPKCNKLQKERIAFIMRTGDRNININYLKNNGEVEDIILNKSIDPEEGKITLLKHTKDIKEKINKLYEPVIETRAKRITNEQRAAKREEKNEYLKKYYEANKTKVSEKAKINSVNSYGRRLCRELNNNVIDFKNMKPETIAKWKIKFINNEYVSEL